MLYAYHKLAFMEYLGSSGSVSNEGGVVGFIPETVVYLACGI